MNVLIVGLGSIASKHIRALSSLKGDFTLYALRSRKDAPEVKGVTSIFSLEELGAVRIGFAIISNPTSEHIATIRLLLGLHCPLFIEKPLFHRLDIEAALAEIRRAGPLTYVACNLRFLDCLRYVKQELEKGVHRINEVNVYCGSYLPEWRPGVDFRKIYSADPAMGGGVHLDLIHELDYLYWIFGMPLEVNACFGNRSGLQIAACDYASYSLAYPGFYAQVVLNYYRRDAKRTFELVTGRETWLVDLRANRVSCGNRILFESQQTIMDTYTAQMDYFAGLVRSGSVCSFNTVEDAYNVLKIGLKDDTRR